MLADLHLSFSSFPFLVSLFYIIAYFFKSCFRQGSKVVFLVVEFVNTQSKFRTSSPIFIKTQRFFIYVSKLLCR